jgi:arylsulfatase B
MLCASCFSSFAAPKNILLIIADDYGVDSNVLYNSTNNGALIAPTPNIVALATNGIVFRNAYANPVCSPTRACVLTGQYGFRTGVGDVIDTGSALTTSAFTLPKAFQTNAMLGYHLAQFGKWHLAQGPNSPRTVGGWTNFSGFIQGAVASYTNWTKVVNGSQMMNYSTYTTTEIVNDATAWISARGTNPWFAWVAFNAPHSPLHLPPTNLCPHYTTLLGTAFDINNRPELYYDAMIEAMDTEIGRLVNAVNRSNTHIIFMGDNGTPNNTLQPPIPNGRGKDTLYEGGIHVPFIISSPNVVSPNRTNDTPVSAVDVFATILEMAGINVAATTPTNVTIDSRSLMPVLENDTVLFRYAYSELFGTNNTTAQSGRALRNDQFKLIRYYDGHEEFFDLVSDPYESTNLRSAPLTGSPLTNYYSLSLKLAGYQATLTQPTIASSSFYAAQFSLTVQRATNLNYTLWRSPTFNDLGWFPLTNAIISTNNSVVTFLDTNATAAANFYRVVGSTP